VELSDTPQRRRLADLTSSEIANLPKDEVVVVLPVGAFEQHGSHLPCGTDALLVNAIFEAALTHLPADAPVLSLPALAYGTSSEHLGFPGTISVSPATLLAAIREVGMSLARSGFCKLVCLNGHGGQVQLLEVAARDLRVEAGLLVFPVFPYRAGLPHGLTLPDGGPPDIHGGWIETSLMLAVAPELVHLERAGRDGDRATDAFRSSERLSLEGAFPTAWVTADISQTGVVGDPTGASVEAGAQILDHLGKELALVLTDICRFGF